MNLLSQELRQELRLIVREEMLLIQAETKTEAIPEMVFCNQQKACEILQITEPTIIRWRNKGKIPFIQIGSSIRYDMNEVVKTLKIKAKK
jgi:excisionase family DNA binding protein